MRSISFLSFLVILIISCDEPTATPPEYRQLAGIWVPYEYWDQENDIISHGPFTANGIFGSYSESVQFNLNKKYIPIIWTDKNNYMVQTLEGGNFEYISEGKRLRLTEGAWDMDLEIAKLSDDELWLVFPYPVQIKFKRQHSP